MVTIRVETLMLDDARTHRGGTYLLVINKIIARLWQMAQRLKVAVILQHCG